MVSKLIHHMLKVRDVDIWRLNSRLHSTWIRKSRYAGFYCALLLAFCAIAFNIFNYTYTTRFNHTLPPVDIVDVLARFELVPTNYADLASNTFFSFDNSFLLGLLRYVYARNEEEYISPPADTTIAIVPTLEWSPSQILLVYKEGIFSFSENEMYPGTLSLGHLITRKLQGHNFLFGPDILAQGFIKQFVYALYHVADIHESFYDVDSLQYAFFVAQVCNLGILVLTILSVILLVAKEFYYGSGHRLHLNGINLGLYVACQGATVVFLLLKMVVSLTVHRRFFSTRSILVTIFSGLQAVVCLVILAYTFAEFRKRHRLFKEDRAVEKLVSSFQPSIHSSVYEESEEMRSLDPMKTLSVERHPSSAICDYKRLAVTVPEKLKSAPEMFESVFKEEMEDEEQREEEEDEEEDEKEDEKEEGEEKQENDSQKEKEKAGEKKDNEDEEEKRE